MFKPRYLTSLLLSLSLFSLNNPAIAQITPDLSLGLESAYVIPFNQLLQLIQGGAIRGDNLFQSFQDFNISEGQTIILTNPNGVNQILLRVTGNNPSEILGNLSLIKAETINNLLINLPSLPSHDLSSLIQPQDLGTANLFFLNPNGILFGPNASLNVGGSFIATTANQIEFADGTVFSANIAQSSPLLTVSTPIGLGFTSSSPQPITVEGPEQPLTNVLQNLPKLLEGPPEVLEAVQVIIEDLANRPVGLQVFPNETIALVGGDVTLTGGSLTALDGRIEVGSITGKGNVSLTPVTRGWALGYEGIDVSSQGQITLSQLAFLNSSGLGGGEIQVTGQNIFLANEAAILSLTSADQSGGDIKINGQTVNLSNGSIVGTGTLIDSRGDSGNLIIETRDLTVQGSSLIETTTVGQGKGGDLIINAQNSVNVIDDGFIATGSLGESQDITGASGNIVIQTQTLQVIGGGEIVNANSSGEGGDLLINASDTINIDDFDSAIYTDTFGRGNAGNLEITTDILRISDGAQISAATLDRGNGGDIHIRANNYLEISGSSSDLRFPSGIFTSTGIPGFEFQPEGEGGNVVIETGRLTITEGALISASTISPENAGNIEINVDDTLSLNRNAQITATTNSNGNAGNIRLTVGNKLEVNQNSQISTAALGNFTGEGGLIEINTNALQLQNRSGITVRSEGNRDSGNINLNVRGLFSATNSDITANANQGSGGEITLSAAAIRLQGDSDIRTNVDNGAGGGGNITFNADSIILFNDSDVLAFARNGQGGNIQFNTPVFFGDGYQPIFSDTNLDTLDGNDRVDINASGAVSGVIIIPDLTFIQNSIVQLSEFLIDPEQILSNSCITPNQNQGGSFTIKGSGGVPTRPGNMNVPSYFPDTIQPIPDIPSQPWKKGDPIIEPQGVYTSPDGRIYLSRDC
ncbi:MAG: filamentous hemagglutinin N-terminal domain-containing protein [Microcystaceae cyanobacterium]